MGISKRQLQLLVESWLFFWDAIWPVAPHKVKAPQLRHFRDKIHEDVVC